MSINPSLVSFLRTLSSFMRTDLIALYSPPPAPGERGSYRPRKDPLTNNDLEFHLADEELARPIGLYVLPADLGFKGLTRCAIIDFDDKKKKLSWSQLCGYGQALTHHLQKKGLITWPCRSGSGHGLHLWLFWQEPQDASAVRSLLKESLAATLAAPMAARDLHIDIFPAQDKIAEGAALGNLVALPFGRKSRPLTSLMDGTVIEDLSTWLPSSLPLSAPVEKKGPVSLDQLANRLGPVHQSFALVPKGTDRIPSNASSNQIV